MPQQVPEISIIAATLNEADNVERLVAELIQTLDGVGATYEIIFADNGSVDGTRDIIKAICLENENIKLICNNTDFGYMKSPTHAMYQASGRSIVAMCSDFQDPPQMVAEFLERWRRGAKIVLAVRRREQAGLVMRFLRWLGYGFFSTFGDYRVIPGATGFGIYDREVVDCLKQWRDPEPFFRGMLVESGYPIELITFDRPERAAGLSKNKLKALMNFGWIALGSSSRKLLRAPMYFGIAIMALSILTPLILLSRRISIGELIVIEFIEWMFGVLFIFMSIMGEQIRILAEISRNKPLVTERERVNF